MSATVKAFTVFQSPGGGIGQEDHVLVQEEKGIFVVADGFGGPIPGAEAARASCEAVRGFLFKEAGDRDATLPFELRSYFSLAGNVLFNSLIHANRKVLTLNKGRNVHEKGGASVLAGYIDGDLLALANVGACEAWIFRGGRFSELVAPRAYGRLCDPLNRELAPEQRTPLMAVGMAGDLEPEIVEARLQPGDWLVMNTNGASTELRERLAAIQREGWPPRVAAEKVLELLKSMEFCANSSFLLSIF